MAEKTVQDLVTENLAKIAPAVQDAVVSTMVEREVTKRASTLVQGLDLLQSIERDSLKLKADVEVYDENGKQALTYFTKERTEERRKSNEKIEKLKRAIEKAITKGEYSDLTQFIGNNKASKSGNSKPGPVEGEVGE